VGPCGPAGLGLERAFWQREKKKKKREVVELGAYVRYAVLGFAAKGCSGGNNVVLGWTGLLYAAARKSCDSGLASYHFQEDDPRLLLLTVTMQTRRLHRAGTGLGLPFSGRVGQLLANKAGFGLWQSWTRDGGSVGSEPGKSKSEGRTAETEERDREGSVQDDDEKKAEDDADDADDDDGGGKEVGEGNNEPLAWSCKRAVASPCVFY
jgi:hypothetical protein